MSYSEDSYPGSSIDLKCKERVTDSDSENGSGDEGERKVPSHIFYVNLHKNVLLKGIIHTKMNILSSFTFYLLNLLPI